MQKLDENLKLKDGTYAADEETKKVFEEYMEELKEYNDRIKKGQATEEDMILLMEKYKNTFEDISMDVKIITKEEIEKLRALIKETKEKIEQYDKDMEKVHLSNEALLKSIDERIAQIEQKEKQEKQPTEDITFGVDLATIEKNKETIDLVKKVLEEDKKNREILSKVEAGYFDLLIRLTEGLAKLEKWKNSNK